MKTYYIHPIQQGEGLPIHRVTTRISHFIRRKIVTEDVHIAWFDPPGTYNESKWNLHYDGCDYTCEDMEECKKTLSRLDGFKLDLEDKDHSYKRIRTKFIHL